MLPDDIGKAEAAWIRARREAAVRARLLKKADGPAVKGLALSGGGIRAAFVARGFMERLAEKKALAQFDYVSSVSGGGYAACMLTDHVGNLNHPATFSPDTYKLEAPPYRWTVMGLGVLLDLLLNFLPVLAYSCLFLLLAVSGQSLSLDKLVGFCLLWGMLAGLRFVQFRLGAASWSEAFKSFLLKYNSPLYLFCFCATATLATWQGTVPVAIAILAGMLVNGAFIDSRPHRFHRSTNHAFRWLFFALLAILAVNVVDYAGHHPWAIWVIIALAVSLIVVPTIADITAQNRANLIFRQYRAGLVARFLPLTEDRPLHAVGQSWNPYPIVNAAANFGATLEAFELTPIYSGSAASGYFRTKDWLPDIKLSDAMAISGGAIDFLKRTARLPSLLALVVGGTNYWVPVGGVKRRRATLSVERMLMIVGARPFKAIRLSDGGFVENLGVLALLKRRAKLVVCLDAGYDPDYAFDDLRRLCITAQIQGLGRIEIPGIETATQARRFRQNTSNILAGSIHYPRTDRLPAQTGIYIHLKISAARQSMTGQFADFPHLTTLDQMLNKEEILALHALGKDMAEELCASALLEEAPARKQAMTPSPSNQ
jgi:hypothetical protein